MATVYKSENIDKLKEYIGDDLYYRQRSSRHACVPLSDDGYFLVFHDCDIKDALKSHSRVCIYCGKKGFVFFGDSERCAEIVRAIPEGTEAPKALSEFLFALTTGDIDVLDHVEVQINALEDELLTRRKPSNNAGMRIIAFRRSLLEMKRYYEQLAVCIDRLIENENGYIPQNMIASFAALGRRIDRLSEMVMHLREFVTQVREAYQAQIDIEQNQIMKILTVITSVFLPLSLIVGWYGMNFSMPEYSWNFGYLYVVGLSIFVFVISIILFRKNKWF